MLKQFFLVNFFSALKWTLSYRRLSMTRQLYSFLMTKMDTAEFGKFDKFEKSAENFTKTLLRFDEVENHLVFPLFMI